MVAEYMPIVEELDAAIDLIEDQVFVRPSPRTLEKLFALKRVLLAMRRIILPHSERYLINLPVMIIKSLTQEIASSFAIFMIIWSDYMI